MRLLPRITALVGLKHEDCHELWNETISITINMHCGLRDSPEKLEAPEEELDLSRALCIHLTTSKQKCRSGLMVC